MAVFLGYIILIGIIKVILPLHTKHKKIFIFLAGFLIFLICALRNVSFGHDVGNYQAMYISLSSLSLFDLWSNFISNNGRDPLYHLVAKIMSLFGASFQVWLAIIAATFCFSVSKLIYKYSDEPYMSFIALISLNYLSFSLTGLRQTIALSIVLLSYKYLRERNILPFLALVLLGTLFHASALIFLIAYPLASMKTGWKHFVGIFVALVLAYFYNDLVKEFVSIIGWTEAISSYAYKEATLNMSGFIIQLCIYLFCLFYKKGVLKADVKNLYFYNLLFLGLFFQVFAIVIAESFRVSMYFSIFSIVLIPKAINAEKEKRLRAAVYLAVLFTLVFYFIISGSLSGYIFYWE